MKKVLFCLAMTLSACSSAPKIGMEHAGEEQIISRIDELGSRPSWVTESAPFKVEHSKVLALGSVVVPADDVNMAAVYRIAANNGKVLISHAIAEKLTSLFQNGDEGIALGQSQATFIGEESSHLMAHSLRLEKQYWEKVRVVQADGQLSMQYRVFALIVMPEDDYKSAILDSAREAQGKMGVSREFSQKLDAEWTKFTVSDDSHGQGVRKPATVANKDHTKQDQ